MPSDENKDQKGPVSISIGKETDSALGDVIRGLLKRPSEELGNLLADGIGLLGDRIRQKRLKNAHSGLEGTREILDERKVDLIDITPPSEEDLHLILEGMSVTSDDQLQKLWSGLLAQALMPGDLKNIDRPIISTISSLSPADARVISYSAFVARNNSSIERDAREAAGVPERDWMTIGDKQRIIQQRDKMGARLTKFMSDTAKMEVDFDLREISTHKNWADNLLRLGIIRPRSEDYSPRVRSFGFRGEQGDGKFAAVVEYLEDRIEKAEALALDGLSIPYLFKRDEEERRIRLGFKFTRFGKGLCGACSLL